MNYSLRKIADSASELLPLSLAKSHLKVEGNDEDTLIAGYLSDARGAVEDYIGRPIGLQVWELGLRQWPYAFPLEFPRPPLVQLQSIKYLCADGVNRVLYDVTSSPQIPCSQFIVDASGDPGELWLTQTGQWPVEQLENGFPIRMRFQCGLASLGVGLQSAILKTLTDLYENRENTVIQPGVSAAIELPMSTKRLCAKYVYKVMG